MNAIDTLHEQAKHLGPWRGAVAEEALAKLDTLLQAAENRASHGHGKNCSAPYSDEQYKYPCDCGHDDLAAAVRDAKGES